MAERLIRRIIIPTSESPTVFQVLWGKDELGGRRVIEAADNLTGRGGTWDRMKIKRGNPGGYDAKLDSREWLLTEHSTGLSALSARDYVEIKNGTARLAGSRIVHTDPEITTELL